MGQRDIISIYQSPSTKDIIGLSSRGPAMIIDTINHKLNNLFFVGKTGGTNLNAGFSEGPNGKYYILCSGGGYGQGTIAEYDPTTNSLTDKVSLNYPCYGDLSYMSGGDFYFITNFGLSKYNCYTNIIDSVSVVSGYVPFSSTPNCHPSGKIYGAGPGISGGNGSIYEYDPLTNIFTEIHAFSPTEGKNPNGELVLAPDGYYYGTTQDGGGPFFTNNFGVIFKFNPLVPGSFVEVNDLNYSYSYHDPYGKLLSSGNNLWSIGNNRLYKLNILSSVGNVVYDFTSDSLNGYEPSGYLTLSSNGKIYGVTNSGGIYNKGVLFEFDTLTNTYSKKYDFDGSNGAFNNSSGYSISGWHLTQINCPTPTIPTLNYSSITNKCIGSPLSFYSTAIILNALNYSWYKDGNLLGVFSSDTLDFANLTVADSGYYVLKIDNACGAFVYSDTIKLNLSCDTWPGDSDNNFIVNNNDLLPIGLHFGETGLARATVSNLWQDWPSTDWGIAQTNNQDIKHADCNGDGVIDNNDTLAINLNFSLTHSIVPIENDERFVNPDIYIITSSNSYQPGDIVNAEIWLGTSTLPLTNLYGVAFNIDYNASLIQTGSENLSYPTSWMGTPGVDIIKLSKIDNVNSIAYGAETRITHNNVNGYGKIADFKFQLKNTIVSIDSLSLSVSYNNAIDSAGNIIPLNPVGTTIQVIPVNIHEIDNVSNLNIYPSPYTLNTQIDYSLTKNSFVILEIYNSIGQKIETLANENQQAGQYSYSFSAKAKGYEAGVYFVKYTVDVVTTTKRIIELE